MIRPSLTSKDQNFSQLSVTLPVFFCCDVSEGSVFDGLSGSPLPKILIGFQETQPEQIIQNDHFL